MDAQTKQSLTEKIDALIDNAINEEADGHVDKARELFEQLDTQIAPGLVKA